jgi:hypothetical protein
MADRMKFRVTPEQIEAARSKLAEAGFPISGESGVVEKDGYRIGYTLVDGVLVLELLSKPRIVPMRIVKSRIRAVLAGERIVEQG